MMHIADILQVVYRCNNVVHSFPNRGLNLVDHRAPEMLYFLEPSTTVVPQVHPLTHWKRCIPTLPIVMFFVSWLHLQSVHGCPQRRPRVKLGVQAPSPEIHQAPDHGLELKENQWKGWLLVQILNRMETRLCPGDWHYYYI